MCAKHQKHGYSNFSFCFSFIPYLVIVIVLEEVGCLVVFLHLFPLCEKSYHLKVSFFFGV